MYTLPTTPRLRALTFGWEYAPVLAGGLGVACAGLARGLTRLGVEVTFVIPRLPRPIDGAVRVLSAASLGGVDCQVRAVETMLLPYQTPAEYDRARRATVDAIGDSGSLYGRDLFLEVGRYAEAAARIAAEVPHDLIHCHDWMTFAAGERARRVSGKPLIVHVHSTEFDRSGGQGANPEVYARERRGLVEADAIVAVSAFTRDKILEHYAIPAGRVAVVHNAIDANTVEVEPPALADQRRIVLFLGRLTIQKGPDWFLAAAARVLEHEPEALFVIAGSGDMERYLIETVASAGLSRSVLFTGFLRGEDIDRAYRMADVYVMPSVSEPFGIAPLEAMQRGTPVILSKQSGVSEVVRNCLKVDFWDTDELAAKILSVLRWRELAGELARQGQREVERMSWKNAARRLLNVYRSTVARR